MNVADQIEIIVNGEPVRLDAGANLARLLDLRQPRPPFAAEVNKRHIRRNEYGNTPLAPGDKVEIVTLVGGG